MKKIITIIIILCLISIAGCLQKTEPEPAEEEPEEPDIIKEMEEQPTPPIEDLDEVLDEISEEEPVVEVKEECVGIEFESASLNGHDFCILNQTDYDFFRFGLKNAGEVKIDEVGVEMHGQKGTSSNASIDAELEPGDIRRMSVFYISNDHGKLWKAELTPKILKSDNTLVECTNAVLVFDATELPDGEIGYCYS